MQEGEIYMGGGEVDIDESNTLMWRMREAVFIRTRTLPAMSRRVNDFIDVSLFVALTVVTVLADKGRNKSLSAPIAVVSNGPRRH